jgi:hypothetical protein
LDDFSHNNKLATLQANHTWNETTITCCVDHMRPDYICGPIKFRGDKQASIWQRHRSQSEKRRKKTELPKVCATIDTRPFVIGPCFFQSFITLL